MSDTITLNINGTEVDGKKGETILEVAERNGVYIPTLCAQPDLTPFGACRLCIVEVERMKGLPPSCTTPAQDGMVVRTNTPQLARLRRNILEFMLSEHPHECLICHRRERCSLDDICLRQLEIDDRCVICALNGRCDLQKVVDYVGVTEVALPYASRGMPVDGSRFSRVYLTPAL